MCGGEIYLPSRARDAGAAAAGGDRAAYFEDLTERQTAEALGIGIGTVKSQARDALARLRERLPWLEDREVGVIG